MDWTQLDGFVGDGARPGQIPDYLDRLRFPADPWRLTESFYDGADLGATETLFAVGNGYLGMRGNVEEGHDSHSHGTFSRSSPRRWLPRARPALLPRRTVPRPRRPAPQHSPGRPRQAGHRHLREPGHRALDGQGPRIDGEPDATALRGVLRADGTLITASVPHHSGVNR